MIPQQYAVECLGRRNKLRAIAGENDMVDQCVHCVVADADDIPRAGPLRSIRAPVIALLVAGGERLDPGVDDSDAEFCFKNLPLQDLLLPALTVGYSSATFATELALS